MALSSITKKLIMSISGLFLILFLLLHTTINFFAVIDVIGNNTWGAPAGEGWYASGCWFMATPVIDIMVPILAAGFFVHIVYAFILTYGNYKARGTERYAVANKTKAESWAAKNMLVLGVIVLGLAIFHMSHFWAEMQYVEWFKGEHVAPESVYALMELTFGKWWMVALYIVWFVALWFHLTHGFWSAFQSMGLSNKNWEKRLMCIGNVFATLLVVCLSVTAVVACLVANGVIPGSVF